MSFSISSGMTDILSGLRILTLAFEGYELDHRRTYKCRVSTLYSMVKKLASLVLGVDISTSAD